MVQIKMTVQYDGTNYHGWQKQKNEKTIQSVIEEAVSKIFEKPIKIRGAGRTDTGVHALGQVATFKSNVKMPLNTLKKALNSLLPKDIRIIELEEVDESFHPQYSVKKNPIFITYVLMKNVLSLFIDIYGTVQESSIYQQWMSLFLYSKAQKILDVFQEAQMLKIKLEQSMILQCRVFMKLDLWI